MNESKMPDRIWINDYDGEWSIEETAEPLPGCVSTEYVRAALVPRWKKYDSTANYESGWYIFTIFTWEIFSPRSYVNLYCDGGVWYGEDLNTPIANPHEEFDEAWVMQITPPQEES